MVHGKEFVLYFLVTVAFKNSQIALEGLLKNFKKRVT